MNTRNQHAFTRIELVIVIAVLIVLLAVVVLPGLARSQARSCRINCVSNLKQLGIACRLYANDNDRAFVTTSNATGWPPGTRFVPGVTSLKDCMLMLGNEVSSPRVLLCPADVDAKSRDVSAQSFTTLTDRGISYFLALDVDERRPGMLLMGDRNLCSDTEGRILFPADGVRTNALRRQASWQRETIHKGAGNLGVADGSAQQSTSRKLVEFLAKTGDSNNTVLLPKP